MILGAFLGAVISGPLGHYYGRKVGIWAAVLTSYLSISIMIVTTNLGALYFARIVVGVSNGIPSLQKFTLIAGLFIAFCVLYLTETSPGHLRGAVVSAFQMYLVVGQIIGSVVDNYTQVRFDRLSYQIPLIVLYAVPVFFTALLLWIPDTPRWLLQKDRVEDAKSALYKLHGRTTAETVISEQLADIQAAIKAEEAQGGIAFFDLFRGTDLVLPGRSLSFDC
jgi:MFS family permease